MSQSFTKKSLEVEIILAAGDFGGGNTKTIRGLPCEIKIEKPGLPEKNKVKISIYGLPYDDLANLTTLSFRSLEAQRNLISVRAGDEDGTLSVVFQGEISSAYADFNSAPNVSLEVEGITGYYPQRQVASPTSVNGEAMASALIAGWAGEIGYSFTNNGVSGSVRNAVFNGSPLDKIQAVASHVGAELIIDDNNIVLLPAGGTKSGTVPLISAETGMLGYPTFNDDGILAKCIYRPDIELGGLVKIESIVPKATGTWKVTKLSHSLSAYVPGGGPWETSIEGLFIG